MKKIPLTQGKFALVDDEDFDELNKYKWSANNEHGSWYAVRNTKSINGKRKTISMHQQITKLKYKMVDHIDRDGLNNQKCNFRQCNHSLNGKNRLMQKNNKSGLIGVSWHKQCKKWIAHIQKDEKDIHIGYFNNKIEAGHMVDQYAICLFGEFVILNFPEKMEVKK